MPSPDLMIRTSGEQRISNYLLWQLAYAELYFTPIFGRTLVHRGYMMPLLPSRKESADLVRPLNN